MSALKALKALPPLLRTCVALPTLGPDLSGASEVEVALFFPK